MMTAAEAAEAAKGLTFEKVWTMFQELAKKADQRQEETDHLIKELSKEADRRQEETAQLIK
jgi:hypothetical protein